MPSNIATLFEQAKKELIAEIKSGKIKLNEAQYGLDTTSKFTITKPSGEVTKGVKFLKNGEWYVDTATGRNIGGKVPDGAKVEIEKLSEAADPSEVKEIQKLVKVANILIEKGKDKDGDKLEVVDPESTYEEPYTYDTIKMDGSKVTVTSYATMKGNKKEVDVMKVDNISDDLEGYLKGIIKGFKRSYKEAGVPLPTNSTVNEDQLIIPTDDGNPDDQTKQQAQSAIAKGTAVKYVKKGSPLSEEKEKEESRQS